RSVTAFWQRWHITLTTWFRDYLYRPLVGSSKHPVRRALSIYTVFFLCGLWHGANWTFVAFGLYFGTLLVIENRTWHLWGKRMPRLVQHAYTLLCLVIGIAFFRSPDLAYAYNILARAAGLFSASGTASVVQFLDGEAMVTLVFGTVAAFPTY